jgi:hypothetical protein
MKKNALIFGSISGLIITTMMLFTASACYTDPGFKGNDVIGYTALIAAFSFIFIGIRNYRDKHHGGAITFGKAFKTGFYITLTASTIYVVVWLVDYYLFIPDFMDKYELHVLTGVKNDGGSEVELAEKAAEMKNFKAMYKNPLFVILVTYAEVFPIGLAISLISALILKRKPKDGGVVGAS